MRSTREEMQQEALSRAIGGQSLTNWPAIIHGFAARGIPEHEIRPRENVLTYRAWQALGRASPSRGAWHQGRDVHPDGERGVC